MDPLFIMYDLDASVPVWVATGNYAFKVVKVRTMRNAMLNMAIDDKKINAVRDDFGWTITRQENSNE